MADVIEQNLDQVAASLLVKPAEAKTAPKVEEKANVEEAPTDEESDEAEVEDVSDEETPDAEPDSPEADDEEDVDADEFEIDIVVDGAEQKVKLKDLKANYSGNSAIEKRLQEVTEAKAQATKHNQQLFAALNEQATRLVKLDEILQKQAEPEINWEELKRTNLPKYLIERDKQREAKEKQAKIQEENARVTATRDALQAEALKEYTANEAKQLVAKFPELADPVKSTEVFSKLVKAGAAYGYDAKEVSSVLDHRAMLVLRDAQRYQELMEARKKAGAKPAAPTTLLRPGASKAKSSSNSAKKLQEALVRKARATGKVNDVAALLVVKKK